MNSTDPAEVLAQDIVHEPFLEQVLERSTCELGQIAYNRIERKLQKDQQHDIDCISNKAVLTACDSAVYDSPKEQSIQNTARTVNGLNEREGRYKELLGALCLEDPT